jgi:hypothetical protein
MLCPPEWTDSLPGLAPTRELVRQMLGEHRERSQEVVATLPPSLGEATFENIAANAVIAGCDTSDFMTVVAAVRAVAQPRFLLDEVVTSVHSLWPMVFLSGRDPSWSRQGDSLSGSIGSNSLVARALSLVLRNIAGGSPENFDASTMGRPGKLFFGVAENITLSPWPPWHVRAAWNVDDSVVATYAADSTLSIADMGHHNPDTLISTIADSVAIPGSYNAFFRKDLWLLMSPTHAWIFSDSGWSVADITQAISDHATQPYSRLRSRGLFGFIDQHQAPGWIQAGPRASDEISIVDDPRRIQLAVVGAPTGGYTTAVFGSGITTVERIEHL